MSGARCLFCGSSFDVGRWILKGTGLPVCDRCATTRRQYLSDQEKAPQPSHVLRGS